MSNIQLVLWCGLLIGLLFGAIGQISGFCLHRGLTEKWSGKAGNKLRSFALALAVAIIGTQVFARLGVLELDSSIYLVPSFSWLMVPIGGVLFGYGMTLANGCGARALVLLGRGNMRSLLVLLCLGVAAYITLTGVLAPIRVWVAEFSAWAPAEWLGPDGGLYSFLFLVLVLWLLWFSLWHGNLAESRYDLMGGLVIGLLVVAGWLVTGLLGADDFDPVPLASLTFVAPVGETIQYAMISTGVTLSFGVVVVLGVIIGSWASALKCRSFKWVGFESREQTARSIVGGALMGVGGALALGCSIGQALTGLSTLSFASVLATLGILIGSRWAYGRAGR